MPSFKFFLCFLGLCVLLTNETFLELVMTFLSKAQLFFHFLLKNRSDILGTIKGFIPKVILEIIEEFFPSPRTISSQLWASTTSQSPRPLSCTTISKSWSHNVIICSNSRSNQQS